MSYDALSRYYERLIDFDYQGYLARLEPVKGLRCLDLACGTGKFTRLLYLAGAQVEGVDLSPDMLAVAMRTTREAGQKVLYREGDVLSFSFTRPYDLITVVCDGLNYVKPADLPKALAHIAEALQEGGRLVFDLSTPTKLREVLGDNLYYEDGEDLTYYWQNTLHPRSHSVEMALTFFERDGDVYRRYDEEQTQYWHTMDEVRSAIEASGLTLESVVGEKGDPAKESDHRWIFIITK